MKKTYIITLFLNQQILFESISFAKWTRTAENEHLSENIFESNIYQQILFESISFANGGQEMQRENIYQQRLFKSNIC